MKNLLIIALSLLTSLTAIAQSSVSLEKIYGETCDQAYNRIILAIETSYKAGIDSLNDHYDSKIREEAIAFGKPVGDAIKNSNEKKLALIREHDLDVIAITKLAQSGKITQKDGELAISTSMVTLLEGLNEISDDLSAYEIFMKGRLDAVVEMFNNDRADALAAAERSYFNELQALNVWSANCTD